ncbi:MAG: hypothetical protein ACLFV6_01145 [Spirulinaceae cyanobacterium]
MKTPVIAIGLDAAEPTVMEKWMFEGHLPNMLRLREQGSYSRLQNFTKNSGFQVPRPLRTALV